MPEQNTWQMIINSLVELAAVGALGLISYASMALKQKLSKETDLKKLDEIERAAFAAVRAAEQKIDDVSSLVDTIVGPAPTDGKADTYQEWLAFYNDKYKKLRATTNADKKSMVMNFLTSKFPGVPFEELEIHLEKAYKELKDSGN